MLILAIRSDKPEAELYLLTSLSSDRAVETEVWQAHRSLSETIHSKIKATLARQHKTIHDLTGIVVFCGPGSFTGLRISVSVANALSASLNIPVVGSTGNGWIKKGLSRLPFAQEQKSTLAIPQYGSEPHITTPKK